jgi:hypothetical protein
MVPVNVCPLTVVVTVAPKNGLAVPVVVADTPEGPGAIVSVEPGVVEQSPSPPNPDQLTPQPPQLPVKVVHEQCPPHPLPSHFQFPPPRGPPEAQSPYPGPKPKPKPLANRAPPEVAEKVASAGTAVIGLPLLAQAWAIFPKMARKR